MVIPASPDCGQSRETSSLGTSASLQPGVSHRDVRAGIVLRKQLYSGRSKPLDDDDDELSSMLQKPSLAAFYTIQPKTEQHYYLCASYAASRYDIVFGGICASVRRKSRKLLIRN